MIMKLKNQPLLQNGSEGRKNKKGEEYYEDF
jgi:hypothetical protein